MKLQSFFAIAIAISRDGCQGKVTDITDLKIDDVEVPTFLHICYKDEPGMDECVGTTMRKLIARLATGIPELGVAPVEPMRIQEVTAFDVGGFRLRVTGIVARGLSNLTIATSKGNVTTKRFSYTGGIERVLIDANYELSGHLMFVPIHAVGTISVVAYDLDLDTDIQFGILPKRGINFMRFEDIVYNLKINKLFVRIKNLGLTGEMINRILNFEPNNRIIVQQIAPILAQTIRGFILKHGDRIFNTLPFDKLFPDTRMVKSAAAKSSSARFTIGHKD